MFLKRNTECTVSGEMYRGFILFFSARAVIPAKLIFL